MLKNLYKKINKEQFKNILPDDIQLKWMDVKIHNAIVRKINLPHEKVLFGHYDTNNEIIYINEIIKKDPEVIEMVLEHEMKHIKTHLEGKTRSRICLATGDTFNKLIRYKFKWLRLYG